MERVRVGGRLCWVFGVGLVRAGMLTVVERVLRRYGEVRCWGSLGVGPRALSHVVDDVLGCRDVRQARCCRCR